MIQTTTRPFATRQMIFFFTMVFILSSLVAKAEMGKPGPFASPVITLESATYTTTEVNNFTFEAANNNSISIADADGGSLTITIDVRGGGHLTLSQTTGLSFTEGDGDDDSDMSFSGTIADINAAFDGATYVTNEVSGVATLTITADDGGTSDTQSIIVQVNQTIPLAGWGCPSEFYQVISGNLRAFNPITGNYDDPINTNIGTFNTGGYNIVDDYMYAEGKSGTIEGYLIRIGGEGRMEVLGQLSFSTNAGDIDDADNWWVRAGTNMRRVSGLSSLDYTNTVVSSPTVTFSGSVSGNPADIVYINDGTNKRIYGATGSKLIQWDTDALTKTEITTTLGISGTFGAAYTDRDNRLFISNNAGGVYLVENYTTASANALYLQRSQNTSNNDGFSCPNAASAIDQDEDSILDPFDDDSDGDGISNADESNGENPYDDTDGDGIWAYLDTNPGAVSYPTTDSNGDDIVDYFDTDLDGVPDFLDIDSDNDGIYDIWEAGASTLDADLDGRIDAQGDAAIHDLDGDDIPDVVEAFAGADNWITPLDTDTDLIPDRIELDADNDGCNDVSEAGFTDGDDDGLLGNIAVEVDLSGKVITGIDGYTTPEVEYQDALQQPACSGLPTISISLSIDSVYEDGTSNLVYELTRTGDKTGSQTVGFTVAGTGVQDTDYTTSDFTGFTGSVTFNVGEAFKNITVDPTADLTLESNRNVIISLSTGVGYELSNADEATGVILEDDADADLDGLSDAEDLDDDNDGILDTVEETVTSIADYEDLTSCSDISLNFSDATSLLESGVDGSIGAIYRFEDVLTNVDARVEITDLSNVTLDNIDDNTGTASYFQPELTNNAGGVAGYIEFTFSLINSVTSSPVAEDLLFVTAHDIDGNGSVAEAVGFDNISGYAWETASNLTGPEIDFLEYKFTGPTTAAANTTFEMVSAYYRSISSFVVRIYTQNTSSEDFILSFDACEIDNYTSMVSLDQDADSDEDGIINSLDLDSDNDGIYDAVEADHGQTHSDGQLTGGVDADGIPSSVSNGATGVNYTVDDTDADQLIDAVEIDSDNDGCFDVLEAGYADTNNSGRLGGAGITVDAMGRVNNGVDGYTVPDGAYKDAGQDAACNPGGNDVPEVDLDGTSVSINKEIIYTESDAPTSLMDDVVITDTDDTTFPTLTMTLIGLLDGDEEVLNILGTDFPLGTDLTTTLATNYNISYVNATGVFTITRVSGELSNAEVEALLEGLSYDHTNDINPADGDRTLSIVLSDGDDNSTAATVTIDVEPVNDLPTTDDVTNSGTIEFDADDVDIDNPSGADLDGTIVQYRIKSLPTLGTLYYADGTTPVADEAVLTVAEADGLKYDPSGTVGDDSFTIAAIDNDGGEDATPATITIPVSRKALTITATNQNKEYGTTLTGAAGYTQFTAVGLASGETIGSVTVAYADGEAGTDAVGTYTDAINISSATGGTFTASNYTITYEDGDLTVTAKALTITATDQNKEYGTTLTGSTGYTTFTSTGLANSETIGSVTVAYADGEAGTDAVGTYTDAINISSATGGTFTASNYTITYEDGDLTVTAKALTITATDQNKEYGTTLTGSTGYTTFTSTGLANSETIGSVTVAYADGEAGTDAVGTYTDAINISSATGGTFTASNYTITYEDGDLTVTAKALTITATDQNKEYGTTLTGSTGYTTFTSTGLANSETIGSVTVAYADGEAGTDAVGTYTDAINISSATGGTFTASNYTITYEDGDLTVTAKALTITATDQNKEYGTTLTGSTGYTTFTSTGLANSETIGSVTVAYADGEAGTDAVGTYTDAINISSATGGTFTASNYTITYEDGDLTVTAKALTITATDQNKEYGTTLTGSTGYTTFTSTGLANSETIGSVTVAYADGEAGTDAVGTYTDAINISSATGGTFTASNYTITYEDGDLTVTAKALTITATDQNKEYGTTLTGSTGYTTFTSTGLANSETIGSVTVAYADGEAGTDAVGTYTDAINISSATGGTFTASNYTITYEDGDLTVTAKALTITATDQNKEYGTTLTGSTGYTTFTSTGLANSETIGSVTVAYADGEAGTDAVGTYTDAINISSATGGTFTASNYTITYEDGDLTVTAKALTITATDQNKEYGTTLTGSTGYTTFTSTGLANSETIGSVTVAYADGEAGTDAVGTYTDAINISSATGGTFTASNYTITYEDGDLTVTAKALTITATDQNKEYGTTLTGSTGYTTFTSTGLANSETIGSVTVAYADGEAGTDAVGTYTDAINISSATGGTFTASNYTITYEDGDLTVTAKALTITATDQNKEYGTTLTGSTGYTTFTSTGLANSETIGSVTVAYADGEAGTDAVGTYTDAINISSATGGTFTASNYTITYEDGDLTVTAKALTITATDQNKEYGTTLTGSTGYTTFTSTGLANSETIGSVTVAYADGEAGTDAVGTYTDAINISSATGGTFTASNYTITYEDGDLTVTAKALTITATDQNKEYGTTLTGSTGYTTFTSTGLANSETIGSVTVAYADGEAGTDAVGTYNDAINISSATGGTFTASNYTITYEDGDLTVTAKALTITATDQNKEYGTTLTGSTGYATFTSTGLANSETIGSVTVAYADGEAGTDAVGTYTDAINISAATGGTFTASNYTITYEDGDLTVTAKALTITADDLTITYGTDPASLLTVNYTGFIAGEDETDLGGSLSFAPITDVDAGTYVDVILPTGYTSTNYAITYAAGDLTISPKAIEVTADNKTKVYGDVDPALTFTVTSGALEVGDNITGSLTRVAGENIGTYAINQGTVDAGSNYDLTFVAGEFEITVRPITVTADDQVKTFADADPTLTYAITTGTLVAGDVFAGDIARVAGETPGDYAIQQGTLALSANYDLTFVEGTFTILGVGPTADDDALTVDEGATGVVDVADGDIDPDGSLDLSSINVLSVPIFGTLTDNGDGTFTYLHDGSETISDEFTYTINDNEAKTSNVATVTITIIPQNDPPVAEDDLFTIQSVDGISESVVPLTSDPDSNVLSYSLVEGPEEGTLTFNPDGTFTYVPVVGFVGQVTFIYQVNDDGNPSLEDQATITIVVPELDSDGDGVPDSEEVGDTDDPSDCDNDGIPDYLDEDECETLAASIVITPNGDKFNDFLKIEGIHRYPNNTVIIFNRWGNEVWRIDGYSNTDANRQFSGFSNTGFLSSSGNLPDGTYFYVIDRKDGSDPQKGFVVIKE